MELPDVFRGSLDADGVRALAGELARDARVLDVLLKGAADQRKEGRPVPIAEAVEALIQGEVRGVQIRYAFDGGEWRDTLMRRGDGFEVVRMRTHGQALQGAKSSL